MTKHFNCDLETILSACDEGMKNAAEDLRSNHIWINRTRDMERAIHTEKEGDEVEIVIDVPYATQVDFWKPYIEELIEKAEANVLQTLEATIGNK